MGVGQAHKKGPPSPLLMSNNLPSWKWKNEAQEEANFMLKLNAKLPKDLLPSLFSKKVTYATFAKEESDQINHDGHCAN